LWSLVWSGLGCGWVTVSLVTDGVGLGAVVLSGGNVVYTIPCDVLVLGSGMVKGVVSGMRSVVSV
jgi:hypothetical protein